MTLLSPHSPQTESRRHLYPRDEEMQPPDLCRCGQTLLEDWEIRCGVCLACADDQFPDDGGGDDV
jgi:hypothetical protein